MPIQDRMQDFYFELELPDGTKEVFSGETDEEDGEEDEEE